MSTRVAGRGNGAGRREARERALELLYEAQAKGLTVAQVIGSLPVEPDPYATAVALGVADHQAEIDEVLGRTAKGWSLERMATVDLALLRMAAWELAHRAEVPTAVAISEAVALAKQFSTEDSGRFVNGVLASVAAEVRAPDRAP